MPPKLDLSHNYSYLAIAAFFGFLGFMMQPTAYTWGEQDMMPFFERIFNPNYLTNDFFTNSTALKNPRWVFGYFIVAISRVSTLPWYKTLYVLKLLFLTVTPILYFKVLVVVIRKYIDKKALSWVSPFMLICLILMVFLKDFRYYFSVGSWPSYYPAISAHNVSIAICFIGILIKERGKRPLLYLPFFFLSCLIHPAMGLFSIGFYVIFLLPKFKNEFKGFTPILVSAIIAVVLVKFVFAPEEVVSVSKFIEIYVKEGHPWHYSVPDFSNLKGDWVIFFALMNVLYLIPFIYGLLRKRKELWSLSLFAWGSYAGVIAMQYFFIEVIPLKLIAYLGVSRFSIFGYWMLVVLWAIALSDFFKKNDPFVFPSISQKNFAFIIINLIFVGILFLDNPREISYNNRKDFYDFVQRTPEASIFMTYYAPYNTDMRLIGRRGVFVSDEFPFAESTIIEYVDRYSMMFGLRSNEPFGMDYYRNLRPKDFIEFSKIYQLDFILIENLYNAEFIKNKAVWKNHKHSIYSVKSLKY